MKLVEQPSYVTNEGTDDELTIYPDPIVELTEYNVHDVLACSVQNLLRECMSNQPKEVVEMYSDSSGCFGGIRIVPDAGELFNQELIDKWNAKLNELYELLHQLDAEFHDDAEYTC